MKHPQKSYVVGTVLGKVTATGKYKISVQTANDGSQNPIAIVVGDKLWQRRTIYCSSDH